LNYGISGLLGIRRKRDQSIGSGANGWFVRMIQVGD
jgi:hypothetical protein